MRMRSAGCPLPLDHWLSACSLVRLHVFALIQELVVSSRIVVQHVQVTGIQEVAVFGIAEVDDSALFGLAVGVGDLHAFVAEALVHAADSVQGDEALCEGLGLVIPVLAGVDIVGEVGSKAIGDLGGAVSVAGDGLVADVGLGHSHVLHDLHAV